MAAVRSIRSYKTIYVGYDTLKFYVKEQIMNQDGLFSLLKTLRIFSPDVYTSYESVAEEIMGSHVWHMWWDECQV